MEKKKNNITNKTIKDMIWSIVVVLGVITLIFVIFMALFNPSSTGRFFKSVYTTSTGLTCTLDGKEYIISTDTNYDVECESGDEYCSDEMIKDIKENCVTYINHEKNAENIRNYIKSKGGSCE